MLIFLLGLLFLGTIQRFPLGPRLSLNLRTVGLGPGLGGPSGHGAVSLFARFGCLLSHPGKVGMRKAWQEGRGMTDRERGMGEGGRKGEEPKQERGEGERAH